MRSTMSDLRHAVREMGRRGADRMMQLALRNPAGQFRFPGMSGAPLEQLRQARSIVRVILEDGGTR
jgi:hypothetical protein